MAPMIFPEKDSYLFSSFDTFGKRVAKGREPAKKCERIYGDHRRAS